MRGWTWSPNPKLLTKSLLSLLSDCREHVCRLVVVQSICRRTGLAARVSRGLWRGPSQCKFRARYSTCRSRQQIGNPDKS